MRLIFLTNFDHPYIILNPEQFDNRIKSIIKEVMGPLLNREEREFLTQNEVKQMTGHHNDKLSALVEAGVLRRGGGKRNYKYAAADVYAYLRGDKEYKRNQRIPSNSKKNTITKVVRAGERIYR